jgi:hypothetical protein
MWSGGGNHAGAFGFTSHKLWPRSRPRDFS